MATIKKKDIGGEIANIFGIKHCREIDISLKYGSSPTVTVVFYPEIEELTQILPILKKYTLLEIE